MQYLRPICPCSAGAAFNALSLYLFLNDSYGGETSVRILRGFQSVNEKLNLELSLSLQNVSY